MNMSTTQSSLCVSGVNVCDQSSIFPFTIIQTSSSNPIDSSSATVTDEGDVAEFHSDTVVHVAPTVTKGNVTIPTQYQQPDYTSFLTRPYPVITQEWTGAHDIGSHLFTLKFPDLLLTIPFLKDKLRNFCFLKAGLKLSVQVNGAAGQYGRLVFGCLPYPDSASPLMLADYFSAFTSDWFQVDAANAQSVDKVYPFSSFLDRWLLGSPIAPMYGISCFVSVPLTPASGLSSPVSITVYASFSNPEVTGYTFVQTMLKSKQTEAVQKTSAKTVSSLGLARSVIPTEVQQAIPMVGEIASAIDSGIAIAGPLLSLFGLSNPPNLSSTSPMQFRMPLPMVTEDSPLTRPAGPNISTLLNRNFDDVSDSSEAVMLTRYAARPSLLYTGKITADDAEGTNLIAFPLTPLQLFGTDYATSFDTTSIHPTCVSYVARFFNAWRGGFRICFSFVGSPLQSARFRIGYIPNAISGVNPSLSDASNARFDIVDFRGNKEWLKTIRFDQQIHWKYTDYANNSLSSNGVVYLQVQNKLACYSGVSNPIYYQIFISAADDFQFAMPHCNFSLVPAVIPGEHTEEEESIDFSTLVQTSFFSATFDSQYPSNSCTTLFSAEYPELFSPTTVYYEQDAWSSQITSFRQLTNMASYFLKYVAGGTFPNQNTVTLTNAVVFPSSIFNSGQVRNMLLSVLSMFRFYRGSFRLIMNQSISSSELNQSPALSFVTFDVPTQFCANRLRDVSPASYGYNVYSVLDLSITPLDSTLPYNSVTKCKLICMDKPDLDSFAPSLTYVACGDTAFDIFVGGGDDLIFGVQMPIPTCRYALSQSTLQPHPLPRGNPSLSLL